MECSPESDDEMLKSDQEEADNDTIPVPPPTFRERLRSARRIHYIELDAPLKDQETFSAEDATHSSKRR
ncbi:MAG: hypothetical protein CUN50_03915 [Candidatus Thermofonsia Clade 1 bacterium]|jgi:hypothetical protein|uniref:Uncharacterized protein n=1 Tax=Candidatus Thermofonsia Clade 1 bacterium TaxID=2364210 RepID=A0A2M8PY33_9CHLR|nr:MAG: hypothetical protein CUN50_03915 [Candidatus Thermofonsia Clade 1 bacterium]